MSDKMIEIRISGKDISPGSIRSKDLSEVISAIEDMVASYVVHRNNTLKKENIIVGLSSVVAGSVGLRFSLNLVELTIPATRAIAEAVESNNYDLLPSETVKNLRTLSGFTKRHNCETSFYVKNGSYHLLTTMTSATEIPKDTYITGETTIYGKITRVGGSSEPKVQFVPMEGGIIYCSTTETVAKKAGERLYEHVALSGKATWNSKSLQIDSFVIYEIEDYKQIPITEAFAKIRDLGLFEDVGNVDEFARGLRRGNANV